MINNIDNQSYNTDAMRSLNSYHYGNIINLLRFLAIFLAVSLGGLSCFSGYLVFKQQNSDLVYFATLDGTYVGTKQADATNNTRAPFEVENFSMRFIQDGFDHSENNYQENIERALTVMNNASRVNLKKLFSDDSLFQVYKESNGVTTIHVKSIRTDTQDYPYRAQIYFQTDLKFLTGQGKVRTHSYHQGIALAMQTTARCSKNPYGLMITDLTFLNNEEK